MKMELLDNGCLKIVLSNEELEGLGLSFAQLDYRNAETREVIQQLLLTARQEIGFHPSGEMTVEAVPLEGGCLLLVTPVSRRRIRMRKMVGPYIYRVGDVEGLFRLAENWDRLQKREETPAGSSLYRLDDGYGLVLYPAAPLSPEELVMLEEFARPAGEGDAAAAFTAEHGRPLAVGDALSRLSRAWQSRRT